MLGFVIFHFEIIFQTYRPATPGIYDIKYRFVQFLTGVHTVRPYSIRLCLSVRSLNEQLRAYSLNAEC